MEEQKFAHENSIIAIKIQFIKDKKAAENYTEVMIKEKASEINKVVVKYCHVDLL